MAVVVVTDRKNVNDKRAQLRGGGEGREKNGPAGSAALRRESYTGGVYEQKKKTPREAMGRVVAHCCLGRRYIRKGGLEEDIGTTLGNLFK